MLTDTFKETQREYSESVRLTEEHLSRLLSKRRSAEENLNQILRSFENLRSSMVELKDVIADRNHRIQAITEEIEKLDRKRLELVDRLGAYQEEIKEAQKSVARMEKEYIISQQAIEYEQKSIEALQPRIDILMNEKNALAEHFSSVCLLSLQRYLHRLAYELEGIVKTDIEQQRYADISGSFRDACKTDPQLSALWQARLDWFRMLKNSDSPAVKQAARREIVQIDNEFEKHFPGVLSIRKPEGNQSLAGELSVIFDETGRVLIMLPFRPDVWQNIEQGETSLSEESVMRFLWHFVAALDVDVAATDFVISHGLISLVLEAGAVKQLADKIRMQLPGGCDITIDLIRMPEEIQEVLRDETT